MYKVYRFNKRFGNKKFETYEEARSYVRKWIRKNVYSWNSFTWSNNPDIGENGFEIRAG